MLWYLIILSLLVAVGRFLVPGHESSWPGTYEAMAHIWVGFLIGMGFYSNEKVFAWGLLLIITVLEVIMFMVK
jgi:hypothetical protein